MITIRENVYGEVDLENLQEQLNIARRESNDRFIIGCFSAASNITGVLSNVDTITSMLHNYGALSFWDYSAAAPYVALKVNPQENPSSWKDAVFFSGHKFLGAPQSPGVLIAKRVLFRNKLPSKIGGGTVFFVRNDSQSYLKETEFREEGGTPEILGAIKLALAVKFKNAIGCQFIQAKEEETIR